MFEIVGACTCFEVRLPGFLSQGPFLLLWDTSLSFPICEMGGNATWLWEGCETFSRSPG